MVGLWSGHARPDPLKSGCFTTLWSNFLWTAMKAGRSLLPKKLRCCRGNVRGLSAHSIRRSIDSTYYCGALTRSLPWCTPKTERLTCLDVITLTSARASLSIKPHPIYPQYHFHYHIPTNVFHRNPNHPTRAPIARFFRPIARRTGCTTRRRLQRRHHGARTRFCFRPREHR